MYINGRKITIEELQQLANKLIGKLEQAIGNRQQTILIVLTILIILILLIIILISIIRNLDNNINNRISINNTNNSNTNNTSNDINGGCQRWLISVATFV